MRQAFTMIELIFVIVIIGILASVAIPRLAATRDDGKVVQIVQTAVQAVHNLGASYAAREDYSSYSLAQANSEAECFTFRSANGAEGNVTVHLENDCINDRIRSAVATLASNNGLLDANGSDKMFQFAGKKVKF
jgi:general secretion pathway protein G